MKKTLLSIFGALAVSSAVGQASASWSITQNAAWPKVSTGVRILSAVNANVLWATGYDGTTGNTSRNYSWFTTTSNGGTSYTSGNIFSSTLTPIIGDTNTYKIASLDGVSATTCWVISYLKAGQNKGAIHRTTNGGTSWQNMTAPGMFTNTASFADVIHFLTPSIGVVIGDPHPGIGNEYEIWRSTDGGNTWALVPGANIPNPANVNEFGLTGVSTKLGSSNIWFGTNEGRIYRSNDAGQTWNVSTLDPTSVGISEIAFSTPLNGYAWLLDATQSLVQYNTTDGGATWTMIAALDPNLGLNNMGAIPGTSQYASCGAGTTNQIISYSSNAGVNWTDWGSTTIQYLTVDFVNNTTGWAGGFSDPTTVGIGGIYKYSGPAIVSPVAPTAAFNAPPTLCLSGPTATTTLNNTSTGNPTPTYSWTSSPAAVFSSSTAANPTVTFAAAGSYTLSLLASNATGTNVTTQVVVVQACTAPAAAFTAASNACVKYTYTVNNTTTGSPSPTYNWSTSPSASVSISNASAASPSFTFGAAGVYSVTLVATNASGSNTAVQTITVAPCPPNVAFNVPANTCVTTNTIATTNTSSSTITPVSYTWTASPAGAQISAPTVFQPSISFTATGIYTITLTGGNVSGTASTTQTVNVGACAGLHENSGILASINVFPNPSNGVFSIANSLSNENINFTVTNILGSAVLTGKFNSSKNIDLSAQSKGIYFITFENSGNKMTKKIIIE
ncbi:MAG: T9SS type A sorting domain-containing protein [Bacteroidetes bacterium]|nr:T9SS type A sorting domain-containing protein [Bacteroidota bacterium]